MDTVFRDVRVIDGSGGPSYRADVALSGGRIAAIHRATDSGPRPGAARVVEGHGLALSPGFIDMHAHSDLALLRDPRHPGLVTGREEVHTVRRSTWGKTPGGRRNAPVRWRTCR